MLLFSIKKWDAYITLQTFIGGVSIYATQTVRQVTNPWLITTSQSSPSGSVGTMATNSLFLSKLYFTLMCFGILTFFTELPELKYLFTLSSLPHLFLSCFIFISLSISLIRQYGFLFVLSYSTTLKFGISVVLKIK